jgi:hypothetical protein
VALHVELKDGEAHVERARIRLAAVAPPLALVNHALERDAKELDNKLLSAAIPGRKDYYLSESRIYKKDRGEKEF